MQTFVKINVCIEHEIKICLNFRMCIKILQNLILHFKKIILNCFAYSCLVKYKKNMFFFRLQH